MAQNIKIRKMLSSVPSDLYPVTSAGNVEVTPTNNIPIDADNVEKVLNALDASAFSGASALSDATTSASGLMSASDKSKLDNISSGATATSVTQTVTSGTELAKVTVDGVPTSIYGENTVSTYASDGTSPVNGTAVAAALGTLDVAEVGGTGKYISAISETDGKISATAADMPTTLPASDTTDTYASDGTVPVSGTAVAAALATLDVAEVGGTGKYISAISESDGKISATASDMPTSLPASDTTSVYSSTGSAPVSGTAVAAALATLDVAEVGGTGKYISAISESAGKISATASDMPTSLPASNTTDTYNSTGTDPVSGTAVAAALATLDVTSVGGTGLYISEISETDGKISATASSMPTSLPASDTTDSYSATGTEPVSGTAVAAALATLDVTSVGGTGKYISAISESAGKISATASDMPTTLPASDTTDTYASDGTVPVSGKAVAAALGTLNVSSVGGANSYISAISETDGKISATAGTVDTTVTSGSSNLITSGAVYTAIDNLPDPMVFKGSIGEGGTINTSTGGSLPAAAASNKGHTYKVITAGTYQTIEAKDGDALISNGSDWVHIPSGDEPSGTVTSVGITNGDGISVSGGPVTSSGNITVSHSDTSSQASVSNTGRTYIQSITLDGMGHVTALESATESVTNTDSYISNATFEDDSTSNSSNPVKMSLTRSGTSATTITANLPKVSSSNAGVVPKGAAVSSQSQTTKFLREDGSWAVPSYTVSSIQAGTFITDNDYNPTE